MSVRSRTRALIKNLPTAFPCKEGCGTCCQTRVTILAHEWAELKKHPRLDELPADRHVAEITSNAPDEQGIVQIVDERGWCPFLGENGHTCTIYADRPLVCRVYAHTWLLACAERVECPPGQELTPAQEDEFARLAGPPGGMLAPPEKRAVMKAAVLAWRARGGRRPDQFASTPEELAELAGILEGLLRGA